MIQTLIVALLISNAEKSEIYLLGIIPPNPFLNTKAAQAKAILSAKEKRAAGTPVETILKDDMKTNEDYQNYAKRNRIRTVTFMED